MGEVSDVDGDGGDVPLFEPGAVAVVGGIIEVEF